MNLTRKLLASTEPCLKRNAIYDKDPQQLAYTVNASTNPMVFMDAQKRIIGEEIIIKGDLEYIEKNEDKMLTGIFDLAQEHEKVKYDFRDFRLRTMIRAIQDIEKHDLVVANIIMGIEDWTQLNHYYSAKKWKRVFGAYAKVRPMTEETWKTTGIIAKIQGPIRPVDIIALPNMPKGQIYLATKGEYIGEISSSELKDNVRSLTICITSMTGVNVLTT
jgi:hypothetical protein